MCRIRTQIRIVVVLLASSSIGARHIRTQETSLRSIVPLRAGSYFPPRVGNKSNNRHPIDGIRRGGGSSRSSWVTRTSNFAPSQEPRNEQRYPIVQDAPDDAPSRHDVSAEMGTKEMIDSFLTRDNRNTFITRVYTILTAQLIVTSLFVMAFSSNPGLSHWMMRKGRIVPLLSVGLSTIAWLILVSSEKSRRESPLKWKLLVMFTLGEALSVGFLSSFYSPRSVAVAGLTTAVAAGSISAYTHLQKNPKYDLTQWGTILSAAGLIFLLHGMLHLLEILGVMPPGFISLSESAQSVIGASLFSAYLAYHTRLIVSGKHSKYQMNEKDYVFGAICLYSDIINIFLYLLRLLGEDRD